jgi:hypothetical protein
MTDPLRRPWPRGADADRVESLRAAASAATLTAEVRAELPASTDPEIKFKLAEVQMLLERIQRLLAEARYRGKEEG